MKLAEALIKIKDIKGKLSEVQRKISTDAMFKKVDDNQEIPCVEKDIGTLYDLSEQLASFKARIAKTNAIRGLAGKIYEMDELKFLISTLEPYSTCKQTRIDLEYVGMGDRPIPIRTYATYDVEKLAKNVQQMRDNLRSIDIELQKLNWEVDLEEE